MIEHATSSTSRQRKVPDYKAGFDWIGRAWLGRFAPDLCRKDLKRSEVKARFDELMDVAKRLADEKAHACRDDRERIRADRDNLRRILWIVLDQLEYELRQINMYDEISEALPR